MQRRPLLRAVVAVILIRSQLRPAGIINVNFEAIWRLEKTKINFHVVWSVEGWRTNH